MEHHEKPTYDTLAHCCILMVGMLLVAAEALGPISAATQDPAPEPCPCRYIGP
jgi:hypothetical protein